MHVEPMPIHKHICLNICIYMYIRRERKREEHMSRFTYIYIICKKYMYLLVGNIAVLP